MERNAQNELVISDLQQKLHIRRTFIYFKEHFDNVSSGKPDHGISNCVDPTAIFDIDKRFNNIPPDSSLILNEAEVQHLLTCFQITTRIIKTTYGEALFNLVLNKGHKKSSKKEFFFLSQEWKYRNGFHTDCIYQLFPQMVPKMAEITEKISAIAVS